MSEADAQQYGVSRLIAFSDGVFGFAITLLITTIPTVLPGITASSSPRATWTQIVALLPNFYAYALTFYIVGNYWTIHHRLFRVIIKYDTPLLWLNLTLLLFIAFLPVPTAFLGRYGDNAVITAFYAATQALICLVLLILGQYAEGEHRLVDPSLSQEVVRSGRLRSLIAFLVFAASIGVAFYNPSLAKWVWLALLFVRPLTLLAPRRERG